MGDLPRISWDNLMMVVPGEGAPIPIQKYEDDHVYCLTCNTKREVVYQDDTKRHIRIKPCPCLELSWQFLSLHDVPLNPVHLERNSPEMSNFGIHNRPRLAAALMVAMEQGMLHGDQKYGGKETYLRPTCKQTDLLTLLGGATARLAMAIATGQAHLIRRYAGNVANFAGMILHKHLYDNQLPFVGQKVKHVPIQNTDHAVDEPAPELKVFDAEITHVWSETCVNLKFTDDSGEVREHTSVMYYRDRKSSNNPSFFCFDAEDRFTLPQ